MRLPIILLSVLLATNSWGMDSLGEHENSPLAPWFKSLKQPGTGYSCCDVSDCKVISSENVKIEDGKWKVKVEDSWWEVPPEKVLQGKNNPTGEAVACYNPTIDANKKLIWVNFYCFIEPPLS